MNVLFICSRNYWRSPTAETIYKKRSDINVRSAGTAPSAKVRVNSNHILWADIIFVMEKKHKQILVEKFPHETQDKQLVILDIEDNYKYMDEELVEIIQLSVDSYI